MTVAQDVLVVDVWIMGMNSIANRPDLKDVWSNVLHMHGLCCKKAFHDKPRH